MRAGLTRRLTVGLLVAAAACGGDDDGFSPTVETVAGVYEAQILTLTTSTGTVDLLALGAIVDVTLAEDGTTAGRLFVPGAVVGGGDVDEDLAGTWSLSGSTVTFVQAADTFIRDVQFTATQNLLTGEDVFDGATVRLVLVRVG